MPDYQLHPQLANDTIKLGEMPLSDVLLMNDARYPWVILVPRRSDIGEIYQLDDDDQVQLLRESSYLTRTLQQTFNADKMNIAALGNVVPQLHIHHVVRYEGDAVWPKPIWGVGEAQHYTADEVAIVTQILKQALADYLQ
jgi:diadenosine tetraphosphate (Ap4A) HIT family hydrolase